MAVYKNDTLIEQSIYGSSRLGLMTASSKPGYRTLGGKKYELSNHLGNVLAVVTDNIHLDQDSTWGSVVNMTDYYPFGLAMDGRSVQDSSYRYGFNGKEGDSNGEWGVQSHYDYGARIYSPQVGRWLSVDPLASEFPAWSAYTFVFNNPLRFVDPTGMAPDDIIIEHTLTKTLTRVKTDDPTDTWVRDGVTTETGLSKAQTEGRVGMMTYGGSEWKSNEVNILYGQGADKSKVSNYTVSVLTNAMNESGNSSIQVNSTLRTPEDQARIMSDLVNANGMAHTKKLYGSHGDMVLDKYPDKPAMVNQINTIGPSKVSIHLGDPSKINVVDVSPWRGNITNPRNFANKIGIFKGVKVLSPWNSNDRAINVEIPQLQK